MVSSKTYTALKIILALVLIGGLTTLITFFVLPRPEKVQTDSDESVNPCTDFYDYTCGRWTEYPPPPGELRWAVRVLDSISVKPTAQKISILDETDSETDNQAIRKARKVYRVCIDEGNIEETSVKSFLSFINDNGGWPLAMERGDWNSKNTTWQQIYSKLAETTSIGSLFQLEVTSDFRNNSISRVWIKPPPVAGMSLKVNVLRMLRKWSGVSDTLDRIALTELNNFEKELTKISKDLSAIGAQLDFCEWITIDDLQNVYDSANVTSSTAKIDWLEMIRASFTTLTPEITIDKSEELIVTDKIFFVKLAKLLNKTSHETIANYIMYNEILTIGREVPQIKELLRSNWNSHCAAYPSMVTAVLHSYDKKFSSLESKEAVVRLVENIKEAMKLYIERSAWLDNVTISLVKEKIDAMIHLVRLTDIYSDADLDNFYSEFVPTDSHFENAMRMNSFEKKKNLQTLRVPVDECMGLDKSMPSSNAYCLECNVILTPAILLQEPLFKMNRSSVFHYGMLGMLIGHEISHALDSNGRQFDKNGNFLPWWSQATIDQYEEHAQCFIDQYSKFTLFDDGSTVIPLDGNFTLAENLADSTGLQVTWEAYKIHREKHGKNEDKISGLEGYTDDQLFFLAYGNLWCSYESDDYMKSFTPLDVHSPSRARINGPLSNSQDFAKAFNCPANSPMNPTKKCNIFE